MVPAAVGIELLRVNWKVKEDDDETVEIVDVNVGEVRAFAPGVIVSDPSAIL